MDGEDKPIPKVQEIDSTVPGGDLNIIQTIKIEEPCKTSTPAAHIKCLDEMILAGNFDGRTPIHGPTPDTPPTPVTSPTPVETQSQFTPPGEILPVTEKEVQNKDVKELKRNEEDSSRKCKNEEKTMLKHEKEVQNARRHCLKFKIHIRLPTFEVIKEENENGYHLEPHEQPHNETYCREWVEKNKEQTAKHGDTQDDSNSCINVSSNSTKSPDDVDISSVSQHVVPEVKRLQSSVLGVLLNNVQGSDNPPKKTSSQAMYVTLFEIIINFVILLNI